MSLRTTKLLKWWSALNFLIIENEWRTMRFRLFFNLIILFLVMFDHHLIAHMMVSIICVIISLLLVVLWLLLIQIGRDDVLVLQTLGHCAVNVVLSMLVMVEDFFILIPEDCYVREHLEQYVTIKKLVNLVAVEIWVIQNESEIAFQLQACLFQLLVQNLIAPTSISSTRCLNSTSSNTHISRKSPHINSSIMQLTSQTTFILRIEYFT